MLRWGGWGISRRKAPDNLAKTFWFFCVKLGEVEPQVVVEQVVMASEVQRPDFNRKSSSRRY
jgi:hypothetical protein